ncbi:hypothetical protein EYF80_066583 [Liparis tanakae]|uniref:Uncharacterized protein n=1 Tax=Liparis tanakae TaxID=230148 RepID=A0A4Z2E3G0_9TELE|nr:hypothetical protein EYF80_066583 [Liparis tanakae]
MEESHVGPDPQEEEVHPRKGDEPRETGPYLMGLATPTTVKRNYTGTTSHTAPRQHLKEGQRAGEERRPSYQSPAVSWNPQEEDVVPSNRRTRPQRRRPAAAHAFIHQVLVT